MTGYELLVILIKIVAILVPVLIIVIGIVLGERKVMGYMQSRVGPNRVGPLGSLQLIADAIKFLHKEIIVPSQASWGLYLLAPILSLTPALTVWAVIPYDVSLILADIDAGVLFLFAMTSLGAYGILLAGWSSNSKYAFFGAMRCMAQVISYEIAMGFSLVGVLMAAGSMNLKTIVLAQQGGIWHWYCIPLFPLAVVYWISAVAETNRPPFDMVEGESEIVAGYQVEYSGFAFLMFFIAEYMNMLLVSTLGSLMFFGGWLSPFEGIPLLGALFAWVPGTIWLVTKALCFIYLFIWMRSTFPRYRYDQVMMLGWKALIPVTIVWLFVTALMIQGQIL